MSIILSMIDNTFLQFKLSESKCKHGLNVSSNGSCVTLYEHDNPIEQISIYTGFRIFYLFDLFKNLSIKNHGDCYIFYCCNYDDDARKHGHEYEFYYENCKHRWCIIWEHGIPMDIKINSDLSKSNLSKELLPKELFSKENK